MSAAYPMYQYTNDDGTPLHDCPACGVDLTVHGAVTLHVFVGMPVRVSTRLDADGVLEDIDDFIANGYHAGTSCSACGDHTEFEAREGHVGEEKQHGT